MKEQLDKYGTPDVLVPIRLDAPKESIEKIRWLHERFGFTRFCPDGLSKGYRAERYPTREEYLEEARAFASVREYAASLGCTCGWFCNLTVKSGPTGLTPILRADGTPHPFATCPLDMRFCDMLAADIAAFAAVARPAFIFLEDDFSISAANGCFCEHHLAAFAKRMGKRYEREELLEIFAKDTPEAHALNRAWQTLKKDTLVSLAKKIRAEMDKVAPEIPIGLMQSGAQDRDGDFTEAVAKTLAGERHTPFVRLYGTFYCGFETKKLPKALYHSLYYTEHLPEDILCYHESDSYPHNRFFSAGKQMTALRGAAYSYGMVGSIHFAQQYFDRPFEEDTYGKCFQKEEMRLRTVAAVAQKCHPYGVRITYDPFYNMLTPENPDPFFAECIGRFGIPFATGEASVAFLDARQAKYEDREALMRYLSGGLFLDGEAAKILCERGFGKYLGVNVGEDVLEGRPSLRYDLGALEVITDAFAIEGEGKEMWAAHAYCPKGNGKWMEITAREPAAQIVTEGVDFRGNALFPTMTYFENELGGRVAVMSLTARDNPSQALYNHRRQRLLQRIICKMSDEYPLVTNAPDIYTIALAPRDKEEDLLGMLTLINLCEDEAERIHVYLPPTLRCAGTLCYIAEDGTLRPLDAERTEDGFRLCTPLAHCEPIYIVLKKIKEHDYENEI